MFTDLHHQLKGYISDQKEYSDSEKLTEMTGECDYFCNVAQLKVHLRE